MKNRFDTILPCMTCDHPGTDHYAPPFADDVGYDGTPCEREGCMCEWYREPDWAPSWEEMGPEPLKWRGEANATTARGEQYRTLDGGETWEKVSPRDTG